MPLFEASGTRNAVDCGRSSPKGRLILNDDDGYPIQWLRSAIPSNTLACLNALAEDARRREVLGTGGEAAVARKYRDDGIRARSHAADKAAAVEAAE